MKINIQITSEYYTNVHDLASIVKTCDTLRTISGAVVDISIISNNVTSVPEALLNMPSIESLTDDDDGQCDIE